MQAKRLAMLSSPCLWLIGVTLFLPTVRGCSAIESPAQIIAEHPLQNGLWLSPFVVAELLAILTLIPLLNKREPSPRHFLLSLFTVIPAFASPGFFMLMARDEKPLFSFYAVGAGLAAVAALALVITGARKSGWPRHLHLVAAFTALTLPLGCFVVQIFCTDGPKELAVGAYLFVAAMVGLTLLTVSTLRAITRA